MDCLKNSFSPHHITSITYIIWHPFQHYCKAIILTVVWQLPHFMIWKFAHTLIKWTLWVYNCAFLVGKLTCNYYYDYQYISITAIMIDRNKSLYLERSGSTRIQSTILLLFRAHREWVLALASNSSMFRYGQSTFLIVLNETNRLGWSVDFKLRSIYNYYYLEKKIRWHDQHRA